MSDTRFDPDIDLDPNEAIELDYDPDTDTDETPENDVEHPYTPEPVTDAQPVDEAVADTDLPTIKED